MPSWPSCSALVQRGFKDSFELNFRAALFGTPFGQVWTPEEALDFQKVEFPPARSQEDRWRDLYFELSPSDIELVDEAGAASVVGGTWTLQVNEPPELRREILLPGCFAPSESPSSKFLAKRVFLP